MLTESQRLARRASESRYYHNTDNRPKDLARGAVCDAIRRGKLLRQPCSKCGAQKAEAHHADYSKPLDVEWLCRKCHGAEHRAERCQHGHEMTPQNTILKKGGKRRCRECFNAYQRNYYAARILRGLDRA